MFYLEDIDIIALGYQCKGTIITDDFAIQNIALALNIKFLSCSGKIISEKEYGDTGVLHVATQRKLNLKIVRFVVTKKSVVLN